MTLHSRGVESKQYSAEGTVQLLVKRGSFAALVRSPILQGNCNLRIHALHVGFRIGRLGNQCGVILVFAVLISLLNVTLWARSMAFELDGSLSIRIHKDN